jgi:Spy/CpxP family protein refolding chaperone
MNRALQRKLIAVFVLVFIAGGMTGAFFGAAYARHLFFEFHQPGLMGIRMRDRLRTELNLTPEQVAKISPIVDKTAAQLAEIRRDTGRRVHEVMINAHREMAANLTDDQRLK